MAFSESTIGNIPDSLPSFDDTVLVETEWNPGAGAQGYQATVLQLKQYVETSSNLTLQQVYNNNAVLPLKGEIILDLDNEASFATVSNYITGLQDHIQMVNNVDPTVDVQQPINLGFRFFDSLTDIAEFAGISGSVDDYIAPNRKGSMTFFIMQGNAKTNVMKLNGLTDTIDANVISMSSFKTSINMTASVPLVANELGKLFINSSASNYTITLPALDTLPTDAEFEALRTSTGTLTIVAPVGVFINGVDNTSIVVGLDEMSRSHRLSQDNWVVQIIETAASDLQEAYTEGNGIIDTIAGKPVVFNGPAGFLMPRMPSASFDAITLPDTGLQSFMTDTTKFRANRGTPASPIFDNLLFEGDLPSTTNAYGELFFQDNATETVIAVAGTPVKVNATYSSALNQEFTESGGTLTYTGTDTKVFQISLSASCKIVATTAEIAISIYVNGSVVPKSVIKQFAGPTTDKTNAIPSNISISLSTNDTVEVFVQNNDTTDNITVVDLSTNTFNASGTSVPSGLYLEVLNNLSDVSDRLVSNRNLGLTVGYEEIIDNLDRVYTTSDQPRFIDAVYTASGHDITLAPFNQSNSPKLGDVFCRIENKGTETLDVKMADGSLVLTLQLGHSVELVGTSTALSGDLISVIQSGLGGALQDAYDAGNTIAVSNGLTRPVIIEGNGLNGDFLVDKANMQIYDDFTHTIAGDQTGRVSFWARNSFGTGGIASQIIHRLDNVSANPRGVLDFQFNINGFYQSFFEINSQSNASIFNRPMVAKGKSTFEAPADFEAGLGVNTATVDASAALQVTSTTQGVRDPVMTDAQFQAISSPLKGLEAYTSDDNRITVNTGIPLVPNYEKVAYLSDVSGLSSVVEPLYISNEATIVYPFSSFVRVTQSGQGSDVIQAGTFNVGEVIELNLSGILSSVILSGTGNGFLKVRLDNGFEVTTSNINIGFNNIEKNCSLKCSLIRTDASNISVNIDGWYADETNTMRPWNLFVNPVEIPYTGLTNDVFEVLWENDAVPGSEFILVAKNYNILKYKV